MKTFTLAFSAAAAALLLGCGGKRGDATGAPDSSGRDLSLAPADSSATLNEDPQPQAAITLGLSTLKPAPWRPSTKSIVEPWTYGRL